MNWKRIALVVVGLVALFGLFVVGSLAAIFWGDAPIEDGRVVGTATTITDGGFIGIYAVDSGDGGVILFDTGQDPEATAVKAWLAGRGMGPQSVRAIFVTHGHSDHIGGCGAFPDAMVVAMAEEKPLVEGTAKARGPATRFMPNDGSCHVDHAAKDGEIVPIGTKLVTGYHIPGHTDGTAAWLVDGVLFLGDAASASTSGEVTAPKWAFSNDQDQGLRSIAALSRRLEPAQVQWLAFGHTSPLEGLEPLRRVQAPE